MSPGGVMMLSLILALCILTWSSRAATLRGLRGWWEEILSV